MAWVPAVIGGVASLLGGERRNKQEKDLSGTAHRREVEDLRAAGLNPILSATGGPGASVPNLENAVQSGVNTGFAAKAAQAEYQNVVRQGQVLSAQERLTRLQGDRQGMENVNYAEFGNAASAAALRSQSIANTINEKNIPLADIQSELWKLGASGASKLLDSIGASSSASRVRKLLEMWR